MNGDERPTAGGFGAVQREVGVPALTLGRQLQLGAMVEREGQADLICSIWVNLAAANA